MSGRKSAEQRFRLILTSFIFISFLCGVIFAQEFAWYCRPYGTVNYRGEPAPDRLKVSALIDGVEFAFSETKNGQYELAIPQDDPVTNKKEGWTEGDIITIEVGGLSTVPTFEAFSGSKRIDLYLSSMDVKLTTWGKIKALFK
jgi:hypothetical protein